MLYWKRFVGDYRAKTATLTALEVGIFDLMLDEYFATEEPLNPDTVGLFRLCRAFDDSEQRAVLRVRERFFRLGKDSRLHCDWADARIRAEKRHSEQQRNAADARWERQRQRDLELESESIAHTKSPSSASGSASQKQEAFLNHSSTLDAGAHAEPHAEPMVSQPQLTEQKKQQTVRPSRTRGAGAAAHLPAGFIRFYDAYPRHEAKAKALQAWQRLDPDENTQRRILSAIAWQRRTGCLVHRVVEGRSVVPLPSSWLNAQRWEDEPPTEQRRPPGNGAAAPAGPTMSERINTGWSAITTAVKLKLDSVGSSDPLVDLALAELGGLDALRSLGYLELGEAGPRFAKAYADLAAPVQPAAPGSGATTPPPA